MKSGELARLANVTVRTLRHYRDIGLLQAPVRDDNGYCNYTGDDYFRLLRIKNLTNLGFSLAEIKAFFEHPDTAPDADLDALDARLAAEIERLQMQRQTIARLKTAQVGADVPPAFAEFLALLAQSGLPKDILEMETKGFLAAAHELNETEITTVVEFYKTLVSHNLFDQYTNLCQSLYHADDSLSDAERDTLAADLAAILTATVAPPPFEEVPSEFPPLCDNETDMAWFSSVDPAVLEDIIARALTIMIETMTTTP